MIYGIGHDILEIKRVERLLSGKLSEAFMIKVLTTKECELARNRGANRAEFVAGRFAAKEAITKAFGCGIGAIIGFHDIEILPDAWGKPWVQLSEEAWERLDLPGQIVDYAIHLSISHQREMASTYAIVEKLT
ncbi:MAG TPA: holo-ACP synthase [Paenibacillus sp.]|jgi:holo-[acyl-carrier protein] synthase